MYGALPVVPTGTCPIFSVFRPKIPFRVAFGKNHSTLRRRYLLGRSKLVIINDYVHFVHWFVCN